MIDFTPVRNKEITLVELTAALTPANLRTHTNDLIDTVLNLIRDCTDAHVTFVPDDPEANDTFATNEADTHLAWTLGHVVVHLNASNEESAALAAELARGVPYEKRRSRSEVTWETVTTIAQCRRYLQESRRMCLASLDMWPDEPHLDNTYPGRDGSPYNAITRYVSGLSHADSHLTQIANIIQQAKSV